ncbi:hypothetical protein [Streptoalloteichus hindustanus]|nr:hypothetical protein [Streptoalloteichus hindustanus]
MSIALVDAAGRAATAGEAGGLGSAVVGTPFRFGRDRARALVRATGP